MDKIERDDEMGQVNLGELLLELTKLRRQSRPVIEIEIHEDLPSTRGYRRGTRLIRGEGSEYESWECNGEEWVQIYP